MKKILMFATYPIVSPQHGGQKRCKAIFDAYAQQGFEVKFCAVYYPLHYKQASSEDIPIPNKHNNLMTINPLTGDVVTGKLVKSDSKIRNRVRNLINEFKPEIVHIEQPFLYIGLKDILKELEYQGCLVYGSQNIEYPMKEEMLENEGYDPVSLPKVVKEIKDVEIDIIKNADLTLAVSESDLEKIVSMGAQKDKVVLARNGIEKQNPQASEVKNWEEFFHELGVSKIALFVGSAHPPNWTGFQTMIGHKIGFLGADERIVLAGSIGEYFERHYKHGVMEGILFWKRIISVGRLSEEKLTALIERADCILLPIVEGGGSNLKTAEALLSEKPVVGTSHAFRSFESFLNFPTVNKTDKEDEFRSKISKALRQNQPTLSEDQKEKLKEVTWQECLKKAIEEVNLL